MKDLLRKSAIILRQHPILWVPYIVAEVIDRCMSWFRHFADGRIFRWVANRQIHSALGNFAAHSTEAAVMHNLSRLREILFWTTQYISICIFATAMVFTAILTGILLRDQPSALAQATAKLRTYPKRILVYASKAWLLGLLLFTSSLVALLFLHPGSHSFAAVSSSHAYPAISDGLNLLTGLCFVWLMAPVAINLLRPPGSPALAMQDRRIGQYFYMLTFVVIWAVEHSLDPAISELLRKLPATHYAVDYFLFPLIELLSVFPFIAFALIADPDLQRRVTDSGFGAPEWLRTLMPLHFQPRREP